jgi:hypothetical protein
MKTNIGVVGLGFLGLLGQLGFGLFLSFGLQG